MDVWLHMLMNKSGYMITSLHVSASLVASQEREGEDQISRREHEDEIQLMRLEVQQCKDFIHMQQQLLQVYTSLHI